MPPQFDVEKRPGFSDVATTVDEFARAVESTLTLQQLGEAGNRIRREVEAALTRKAPEGLREGLILITQERLNSQLDASRKNLQVVRPPTGEDTEQETPNAQVNIKDSPLLQGYARIMAAIDVVVARVRDTIHEQFEIEPLLTRVHEHVGEEIDGWVTKKAPHSLATGLKTMGTLQARMTLQQQAQLLEAKENQPDTREFAKQLIGRQLVVLRDRGKAGQLGKKFKEPVRAMIATVRSWDAGIGAKFRESFNSAEFKRRHGGLYGHYLILGLVTDTNPANPKLVTLTEVVPEGESKPMKLGTFLKEKAGWSSNHMEFLDGETPGPESTLNIEDMGKRAVVHEEPGDGFTKVTMFGPEN